MCTENRSAGGAIVLQHGAPEPVVLQAGRDEDGDVPELQPPGSAGNGRDRPGSAAIGRDVYMRAEISSQPALIGIAQQDSICEYEKSCLCVNILTISPIICSNNIINMTKIVNSNM